ncbi:uncharacterized protein BDW47DRAFT_110710, partial [Aspergillus candidus]
MTRPKPRCLRLSPFCPSPNLLPRHRHQERTAGDLTIGLSRPLHRLAVYCDKTAIAPVCTSIPGVALGNLPVT